MCSVFVFGTYFPPNFLPILVEAEFTSVPLDVLKQWFWVTMVMLSMIRFGSKNCISCGSQFLGCNKAMTLTGIRPSIICDNTGFKSLVSFWLHKIFMYIAQHIRPG